MHLVFFTSLVPDGKPTTGYEIANRAVIEAFKRNGVRITVVGFLSPGKSPSDPANTIVLGEIDPATANAGMAQKLSWLRRALATGLPFSAAKLRIVPDEVVENRLKRAGRVDGYILNAVQMSAAYERLFAGKPFLYVAHNAEYLSAAENASTAANPAVRLLYRREARLLKEVEARLCRHAGMVLTFTAEDRLSLGVGEKEAVTLPLVTRDRPIRLKKRRIECDAALIGTWTWQPNLTGLLWFLESVVPRLPAGLAIRIAGRVPQDVTSRFANVEFVGRVEDATAFVGSAKVIPLISRAGTGVQLKTLETFELGLPTVATSRAVRGIRRIPANCMVADTPEAFATALSAACRDTPDDLDGASFFAIQIAELDAAVCRVLRQSGLMAEREPA